MFRKNSCALFVLSIAALLFSSCGGSSSSGSSTTPPPPTPDFTVGVSSNSLKVPQSGTLNFSVTVASLNNFNSPVAVTLSGLPTTIVPSISSFSLNPGGSQIITLNVSALATAQSLTFTISGTSGTLTHSAQPTLTISAGQPNFRIRYVDTAQSLPGFIVQHGHQPTTYYNQQPVVLYHTSTKRFFFANSSQNQILVYDAATESQTAVLSVPAPWSIDQTPDQSLLYVGTLVGDIYVIDPVGLTINQRIPANTIGSNGFFANAAIPLANGNLALLGSAPAPLQTYPNTFFGNGYTSIGIWNPLTNALTLYTSAYWSDFSVPGQVICSSGNLGLIAYLRPTPDRTHLITGAADTSNVVCELNPANGQFVVSSAITNARTTSVVQPPDGSAIINFSLPTVTVFDPTTLQVKDQFSVQWNGGSPYQWFLLSSDGSTLYLLGGYNGYAAAYNWKTHAFLGWASTPTTSANLTESYPDFEPFAIDSTGLMAGVLGHGIGFADMGSLQTGSFNSYSAPPNVTPAVGPPAGGIAVQINEALFLDDTLLDAIFGGTPALNPSASSSSIDATTPAHPAGPADVIARTGGGGLFLAPNAFSYGPSIQNIVKNFSPADGGGTATVFGYGLSANGSATVSVGGQSAAVTSSSGSFSYVDGNTTPLQSLQFTLPPGAANTSATLEISNSAGSTSQSNAITYLPATQQFPLSGAQLYQGIYDPHRNVYYFTDQNKVQIFSRQLGAWQSPISMPLPSGATSQRLTGISLSPNGSILAISDTAARAVYVLNPSTPNSVQTFLLPSSIINGNAAPQGLAVSDQGVVYVATTTGPASFYKLIVSSATFTPYANMSGGGASHILLTPDDQSVFAASGSNLYRIDTANDSVETAAGQYVPSDPLNFDLALSPDGSSIIGGLWLFDSSTLHVHMPIEISEQWLKGQSTVYCSKFSADGKLIFKPEPNAIDVISASTGLPFARIALPLALSTNFDALVSDGTDNVLIAITGATGSGIAVIDLSSVPKPSIEAPVKTEPKNPRPVRTFRSAPSGARGMYERSMR